MVNFVNLAKGFMRLLKKDTPFYWDEQAQESFDALKQALEMTPMLSPPNYSHDFLLYVVASQDITGMVLVQEDEELQEHLVYYLIQNLIDSRLHYTHVKKLPLVTVHAAQWSRNYIILFQTLVVAHINPFQFVLTRRMIGGKYNKWIVILQEFDLEFVLAKSKKSLIFVELISNFPNLDEEEVHEYSLIDEHIFLISTVEP